MKRSLLSAIVIFLLSVSIPGLCDKISFIEGSSLSEINGGSDGDLTILKDYPRFNPIITTFKKAPFIGINPVTGYVEMVYEIASGNNDSEIFHTYWDPYLAAWIPPFQITDNAVNDRDPRITFRKDGKRYVVWWAEESVPSIYLSMENISGEIWSLPEKISIPGIPSSHPNIFYVENILSVLYESSPEKAQGSAADSVKIILKQEGIPIDDETD